MLGNVAGVVGTAVAGVRHGLGRCCVYRRGVGDGGKSEKGHGRCDYALSIVVGVEGMFLTAERQDLRTIGRPGFKPAGGVKGNGNGPQPITLLKVEQPQTRSLK